MLWPAVDWDYTPPAVARGQATDDLDFDLADTRHAPAVDAQGGAFTNNLPISEPAMSGTGSAPTGWSGDVLERIHVTPLAIDYGNVIGNSERAVDVWNAHQRAIRVDEIQQSGMDGINIAGQTATPFALLPLQQSTYTLTATPAGPPIIAAALVFVFAGGETRTVVIEGRRLIAWGWLPDWRRGIVERLEWKTDVLRAYRGKEQRRRLRKGPRRWLEFELLVDGRDRQRLDVALSGWQARVWAMPLWWDGQALAAPLAAGATSIVCDTAGREFRASGLAMLLTAANSTEVVEIDAVGAGSLTLARPTLGTWPAGAMLYPCIPARAEARLPVARFSADAEHFVARFAATEAADVTASTGSLPTFLGYPVLEQRPALDGDLAWGIESKVYDLDNATGFLFVDDEGEWPFFAQQQGWLATDRASKAALRALLFALAGRAGAVWIPTWTRDLVLAADAGIGAANIDVEHVGYGLYNAGKPGRNHIRIERRNGTVSYHKITGASDVSSAVERLSLAQQITPALAAADVERISFLQLMRLDSDAVELAHWTGDSAEVLVTLRSFAHDL